MDMLIPCFNKANYIQPFPVEIEFKIASELIIWILTHRITKHRINSVYNAPTTNDASTKTN